MSLENLLTTLAAAAEGIETSLDGVARALAASNGNAISVAEAVVIHSHRVSEAGAETAVQLGRIADAINHLADALSRKP